MADVEFDKTEDEETEDEFFAEVHEEEKKPDTKVTFSFKKEENLESCIGKSLAIPLEYLNNDISIGDFLLDNQKDIARYLKNKETKSIDELFKEKKKTILTEMAVKVLSNYKLGLVELTKDSFIFKIVKK